MILADTSIWIDHFRTGDARLGALLETGQIAAHPFVIGEIALGSLRQRATVLADLHNLPQTAVATPEETLQFIDARGLAGSGIGYIDAHLLASVTLTPDCALWTRDKRLMRAATKLGVEAGIA